MNFKGSNRPTSPCVVWEKRDNHEKPGLCPQEDGHMSLGSVIKFHCIPKMRLYFEMLMQQWIYGMS